jgi:hypothetical protein
VDGVAHFVTYDSLLRAARHGARRTVFPAIGIEKPPPLYLPTIQVGELP